MIFLATSAGSPSASRRPSAASGLPAGRARRRGTVLIFVLGILTLLALVGFTMLGAVRGERVRWISVKSTQVKPDLMNEVVQSVRERLRADLWSPSVSALFHPFPAYLDGYLGAVVGDNIPSGAPPVDVNRIVENNEPFDAPGPLDRWLGSTQPYYAGPFIDTNYDSSITGADEPVLVWPRVTYLGTDIVNDTRVVTTAVPPYSTPQFFWAINSRTGTNYVATHMSGISAPLYSDPPADLATSGDPASLNNVPVVITQPNYATYVQTLAGRPVKVYDPANPGRPVPGSTTNVTIAEARDLWFSTAMGSVSDSKFPYFDTNMDAIVDLYDADGDGIPDSPLSLALPYPGVRPGDPQQLYAAVRIIDNASMVNLNAALSLDTTGDGAFTAGLDLFFRDASTSFANADYQLRGRRPCEVAFDSPLIGVPNIGCLLESDRGATLLNLFNSRFAAQPYLPLLPLGASFYNDVVRRILVGGLARGGIDYPTFGIADETSLRRRFQLAQRSTGTSARPAVEGALPATLNWTRQWNVSGGYDYTPVLQQQAAARYGLQDSERLDNFMGATTKGWLSITGSDGYAGGGYAGPAPWSNRRPLYTTISYDSTRIAGYTLQDLSTNAVTLATQGLALDDGVTALLLGPDLTNAAGQLERVDLNPLFFTGALPAEPTTAQKAAYIARLALAIYTAEPKLGWQNKPGPTGPGERDDVAWQLALNICDYIDKDDAPSVLVAGGVIKYVGLEIQPFISKAYVDVDFAYDAMGNLDPMSISEKSAIELINPFRRTPAGVASSDPGIDSQEYRIAYSGMTPPSPLVLGFVPTHRYVPWYDEPAPATPPVMGRLVLRNNGSLAVPSSGDATPEMGWQDHASAALTLIDSKSPFKYFDRVTLERRLQTSAGIQWWPVDTAQLALLDAPPATGAAMATGNVNTSLIRDDVDASGKLSWKFTIDDADKFTSGGPQLNYPCLGMTNAGASSSFQASQWVFRNVGYAGVSRAFDTPGDLSRLLAIGTRGASLKTVSQIILDNGDTADVAVGRIDFTDQKHSGGGGPQDAENSANLLRVLTCAALDTDGVNNDGNDMDGNLASDAWSMGEIDEVGPPRESAKVFFRNPGLINVNTAPACVLRCLPYMANSGLGVADTWDIAAAIVAERENRSIESPVVAIGTVAPLVSPGQTKTFASVADLLRTGRMGVEGSAPPTSMRRFANDGVFDLPAHDLATNAWSPDFDAEPSRDNATVINDVRERDILLARWASLLTTRSDVYTVYIALIDENGRTVQRCQFTLDRSVCSIEDAPSTPQAARPILPRVVGRVDSDYADDTR